jgi:hypothetical protein
MLRGNSRKEGQAEGPSKGLDSYFFLSDDNANSGCGVHPEDLALSGLASSSV